MDGDRLERAWAAGFFDGEGWAGTSGRGLFAQINQADPSGMPDVLGRFQRAVGVGRLGGPVLEQGKEPLSRWVASSRSDVTDAFAALAPWLGEVKRKEFEATLAIKGAASAWESAPMGERTAWAAGLFDGEGWTGLFEYSSRPGYYSVELGITQSGRDEIPQVLRRIAELAGRGHFYGPYQGDPRHKPSIAGRPSVRRMSALFSIYFFRA